MKNLIAELLVKLAEKEEESKELVERVAALEIIAAALLRHMRKPEQLALMTDIESALGSVKPEQPLSELLREYMNELLQHSSN